MYQNILVLFSVILLIPQVDGNCTESPVKIRTTASGRNITVCTLPNGLEVLNGSIVSLKASCEVCECGEIHLKCCGFGQLQLQGNSTNPPKECKIIKDGCQQMMVQKADETKECLTGRSILVDTFPPYPFTMPNLPNMLQTVRQQLNANNMLTLPEMSNSFQRQVIANNMVTGPTVLEPSFIPAPEVIVPRTQPTGNYVDRRFVHPNGFDVLRDPFGQYLMYNTIMN